DKEGKKDNAKLLVGTWEVTRSFDKGPAVGAIIELTTDGKVTVKTKDEGKDVQREGTYQVDGDKFTVVMKRNDKESKTIASIKKNSDTELVLERNDDKQRVELKRKK